MLACLHGNDAPPQGVSLYQRPTLQELEDRSSLRSPDPRLRGLAGLEQATSQSTPGAEPASVSCIGDGSSGNRIQAIYAHALGVPDRYEEVATSLREWMAEADQAVWTSAGWWWSSGWRWSTPSLSVVGCSAAPGAATAGTADPAADPNACWRRPFAGVAP